MAIGLGSMDMPIPQIAAWEWVSWKFPKAVRAGETIYARWTLTQKRPPVHDALSGITVWRVDVHTTDGPICAEGEVGASVFRRTASRADRAPVAEPVAAAPRRRRRRRPAGSAEPSAPAATTPAPPPAERTPTGSRRRRRKRGSGSSGNGNGGDGSAHSSPADPPPASPAIAAATPPPASASAPAAGALSRVMRRLRRT